MESLPSLVEHYGYWAILVGTFLEGETILILGGVAAHLGYLDLGWVIVSAFAGTLTGDQFFFYLGRRHARGTLLRYPSWQARIEKAHRLIDRYHKPILIVFRFLYGLRSVTPFAIGLTRIRASRFLAFNALGAAVWAAAFGAVGYLFGGAVEAFLDNAKKYEAAAAIALAVAGVLAWILYRRIRARKAGEESRRRDEGGPVREDSGSSCDGR